ncbi:short-subunit dehydrogenase [Tenacibaculum adriaticum]|uniref:Short-subunit dehydrogenase n=1 Tax=Tenacibaculum adriaticum TaxID=413713 RepID=A0A5S5DWF4_9FLAO|nr:oxidoreductase [Tenacibaculum adriaticum]TYQ00182.1 short-subunit dehydrogenase [Tenacibaculum adriaticum]
MDKKKVILITGASAGMGKDFVQTLLADRHTVYGAARRLDKMGDIKNQGAKILGMDVADDASMVSGIETIIKNEGRIDVLINNAGFGLSGAIEDVSIAEAKYQMEVNLFGIGRLIQLILPQMRKQHSGKIINITSLGGKIAMPMGGWYHASKFALEGLSDSLRYEVKPFGIDVVVIQPGAVKSEWGDIAFDNVKRISGNGAYQGLTDSYIEAFKTSEKNAVNTNVIAKLVKKAVDTKKPKARYNGGYLSNTMLFLRKLLPDSVFDLLITGMFKIS